MIAEDQARSIANPESTSEVPLPNIDTMERVTRPMNNVELRAARAKYGKTADDLYVLLEE
jgi:hypothetical protein